MPLHLIKLSVGTDSIEDLEDWIKPVPGRPLTFRTSSAGRPGDVDLVPFYRLFGKRYAIYWKILSRLPGVPASISVSVKTRDQVEGGTAWGPPADLSEDTDLSPSLFEGGEGG